MPQVTISGEQFEIDAPYKEGHSINAAEASTLNQTFLENIRNNVAAKIKAAKTQAEKDGATFSLDTPIGGEGESATKTLRQIVQEYADSYEFGIRTASTREPVDPVAREAHRLAKEMISKAVQAKGGKLKDIPNEKLAEMIATVAGRDEVQKEAKRRVKAVTDIGLDELGLGAGEQPAEASA